MRLGMFALISLLVLGLASAIELPSAESNQSFMLVSSNSTHITVELKMIEVSARADYDPNKVIDEFKSGTLKPTDEKAAEYKVSTLPLGEPVLFIIDKTVVCMPQTDGNGIASCEIPLKAVCQPVDISYSGNSAKGIRDTSSSMLFCSAENAPLGAISEAVRNSARDPRCIPVLLLVGLLLASMYYAGKSPLALFDITTPRLPKGKKQRIGKTLVQKNWMQIRRIVAVQDKVMERHIFNATRRLAEGIGKERPDLRRKVNEIIGSRAKPEEKAAALKALAAGMSDNAINSILAGRLRWDELKGANGIDKRLDTPEMRRAFAYLYKGLQLKEVNEATRKSLDQSLGTDWKIPGTRWQVGRVPLIGGALGVFVVQARYGKDLGKRVLIESTVADRMNRGVLSRIAPSWGDRLGGWIDKNRASTERIGHHTNVLDMSRSLKFESARVMQEELIVKLCSALANAKGKGQREPMLNALRGNLTNEARLAALIKLSKRAGIRTHELETIALALNDILKNKSLSDMTAVEKIHALARSSEGRKLFLSDDEVRLMKAAGQHNELMEKGARFLAEKEFWSAVKKELNLGAHDEGIRSIASKYGIHPAGRDISELEALIRAKGSRAEGELRDLQKRMQKSGGELKASYEATLANLEKKFNIDEKSREYENKLRDMARGAGVKNCDELLVNELRKALAQKGREREVEKLAKRYGGIGKVESEHFQQVENYVDGKKREGSYALRDKPLKMRDEYLWERMEREIGTHAQHSFMTFEKNIIANRLMYKELVKRGVIKDVAELEELENRLQKAQGSAGYQKLLQEYQEALKRNNVKSAAEAREHYEKVMKDGFTLGTERNGTWIVSSDGTFMPYFKQVDEKGRVVHASQVNPGDRIINGRVMIRDEKNPDVWDRYTPSLKKHAARGDFLELYNSGMIDFREKREFDAKSNRFYGTIASTWIKAGGFIDHVLVGASARPGRYFQEFSALSEHNRHLMMKFREQFTKGEDYEKLAKWNGLRGVIQKQHELIHALGALEGENARTAIEAIRNGVDKNRLELMKQNKALVEAGVIAHLEGMGMNEHGMYRGIKQLNIELKQVAGEIRHDYRQDASMRSGRRLAGIADPYAVTLGGSVMRDIKAAHSGYGLEPMLSHLYHMGPTSQHAPHIMFGGHSPLGRLGGWMLMPSYIASLGVGQRTRAMELRIAGLGNRWDEADFAPMPAGWLAKRMREAGTVLGMFRPHTYRDSLRVPTLRGLTEGRYVMTDEGMRYLNPTFGRDPFGVRQIMFPTPLGQDRLPSASTWGYGTKIGGFDISRLPGVGWMFRETKHGGVARGQTGRDYNAPAAGMGRTWAGAWGAGAWGEKESTKTTMRKIEEDVSKQYKDIKSMDIPGIAYTDKKGVSRLVPRQALSIEFSPEYGYLADRTGGLYGSEYKVMEDSRKDIWRRERLAVEQGLQREQSFRLYQPHEFISGWFASPAIAGLRIGKGIYDRFYGVPKRRGITAQPEAQQAAAPGAPLPEEAQPGERGLRERMADKYYEMKYDTTTCHSCGRKVRRGAPCSHCQSRLEEMRRRAQAELAAKKKEWG